MEASSQQEQSTLANVYQTLGLRQLMIRPQFHQRCAVRIQMPKRLARHLFVGECGIAHLNSFSIRFDDGSLSVGIYSEHILLFCTFFGIMNQSLTFKARKSDRAQGTGD
jgi:hypothetical protein